MARMFRIKSVKTKPIGELASMLAAATVCDSKRGAILRNPQIS
jgi:hypothetical protein